MSRDRRGVAYAADKPMVTLIALPYQQDDFSDGVQVAHLPPGYNLEEFVVNGW